MIRFNKKLLKHLIESLNFFIYNHLKFRNRSNFIVRFSIIISDKMFFYLENKFKLSKRFQNKEIFIDFFDLVKERYINPRNKIIIDMSYFQVRLDKKKDLNVQDRVIKGAKSLCIRFAKKEVVIL
jgi:hypothetical protein